MGRIITCTRESNLIFYIDSALLSRARSTKTLNLSNNQNSTCSANLVLGVVVCHTLRLAHTLYYNKSK